jgi:Insertion element 4 transposase N-terminal/Domain of unknown function (DUF4145)
VLDRTGAVQQRMRKLPSRVGMYFILATTLCPGIGYLKVWGKMTAASGRALEGVCDLHDAKGSTLQSRPANMKEKGLMEGRLWEWAETLPAVRNSAAYFTTESISKQDAEDTVAFTEALLDHLYVLTARFNALKERRTRGAASEHQAGTSSPSE